MFTRRKCVSALMSRVHWSGPRSSGRKHAHRLAVRAAAALVFSRHVIHHSISLNPSRVVIPGPPKNYPSLLQESVTDFPLAGNRSIRLDRRCPTMRFLRETAVGGIEERGGLRTGFEVEVGHFNHGRRLDRGRPPGLFSSPAIGMLAYRDMVLLGIPFAKGRTGASGS